MDMSNLIKTAGQGAARMAADVSPRAFMDFAIAQGWSDGLPMIPPTEDLVAEMVAGAGLPADHVVCRVAPSEAPATVEKIAANAVMAGCLPEYMPVIIAALRAMEHPRFNLAGAQATTHPVAPFVFVNGPIRQRIGLNCGSGALGQGTRANATIGRALRLVMIALGRGVPGKTDMATLGSPCKFTFCAGENEEQSPWEPLHVEKGFAASDSTVLLHAAEGPHNIQEHASLTPDDLLKVFASTINTLGNNNFGLCGEIMVLFSPEHATIVTKTGMSKDDVRVELHRRMRQRFDGMGQRLRDWYRGHRPSTDVGPEVEDISYLDDPSQILIGVCGGAGLHSVVIHSLGGLSHHVIEKIS